jgi:hypothetical protein
MTIFGLRMGVWARLSWLAYLRFFAFFLILGMFQVTASANSVYIQGNGNNVYQSSSQGGGGYGYGAYPCVQSPYGRCLGQPSAIGYPYDTVNYPAPRDTSNLSPVDRHAQWQENERNYERINKIYTQNYDNLGNPSLNNFQSIRPYPRYVDYAYRQEKERLRSAGKPFMGTASVVGTTVVVTPQYYYITRQEAKQYDYLYRMGITSRRRPQGAVVR